MAVSAESVRYRAVSMELAAYLDARYVEMHIYTDTGALIAIVCDKDSIFAVQRHIEQMGRECPEIATWKSAQDGESSRESDRSAFEAAVSEGWSVASRGRTCPTKATGLVPGSKSERGPAALRQQRKVW